MNTTTANTNYRLTDLTTERAAIAQEQADINAYIEEMIARPASAGLSRRDSGILRSLRSRRLALAARAEEIEGILAR